MFAIKNISKGRNAHNKQELDYVDRFYLTLFLASLQQHALVQVLTPGVKIQSVLEFLHNFGSSKARNSCTEKKSRAQEALFYGPFELSLFAEETILNARHCNDVHNGQENRFLELWVIF